MSTIIQGDELRALNGGILVHRATAIPADEDIFSIDGGRILLLGLVGHVTGVIDAGSIDIELDFDPDNGEATIALCTTTLIDGDAVGTYYTLAAAVGSALTIGTQTIALGPSVPWVLDEGDIVLDLTGTPSTDRIEWDLLYVPLDDGASVVAV